MRERIVYRHPKGRFEVVERSGKDIFGNLYRIREARLTPEKDERGRLTDAALPVPVLRDRPEPQRDKPKTTRGGWRKKLTDEEKTWIRRLFFERHEHEADRAGDQSVGHGCAGLFDRRGKTAHAERAAGMDG